MISAPLSGSSSDILSVSFDLYITPRAINIKSRVNTG